MNNGDSISRGRKDERFNPMSSALSDDEFRNRGIEPNEFLRNNIDKAVEFHKRLGASSLPLSKSLNRARISYLQITYYYFLANLVLLAICGIRAVHVVFLVFAAILCVYNGSRVYGYHRLKKAYLKACSFEGIEPMKIGLSAQQIRNFRAARAQVASELERVRTQDYLSVSDWQRSGKSSEKSHAIPSQGNAAIPGWNADPTGRYPQRYFDGTSWTSWVTDQSGAEIQDSEGVPDVPAS